MSFRNRILIAFLLTALLPVLILAWVVRSEMKDRLTAQYEALVEGQQQVVADDLLRRDQAIEGALHRIEQAMSADNRLRLALLDQQAGERSFILDYAGNAMALAGLSMLQIQDEAGRIISSGHFRNEYDRIEKEVYAHLVEREGAALVSARAPEGNFLALVRASEIELGDKRLGLVGGFRIDQSVLASLKRDADMIVSVGYPGGLITTLEDSLQRSKSEHVVRQRSMDYVDNQGVHRAIVQVEHSMDALDRLIQNVNNWVRLIGIIMSVLATGAALLISAWISKPLQELAEKTTMVDLDRLDVNFGSRRRDEFGALSRLLGNMTKRLRRSVASIKDAERRAAIGEMARQVNHDIKNGIAPIRNVFRHLTQLADESPIEVARVLKEREETLSASMNYLQQLASDYARLTPRQQLEPFDLNQLLQDLAHEYRVLGRARCRVQLNAASLVMGNATALRRIVENLIDNAVDAGTEDEGIIQLNTEDLESSANAVVELRIVDQGVGMNTEEVEAAFKDFYTTKEKGTGLGLSIVRRLVMDLGGTMRVESTPGQGTTVIVELVAA